jgi:DNA-damage-inducible protein J
MPFNLLPICRVADGRKLPFVIKVPNRKTQKAIAELEAGRGKAFANLDSLMADMNAKK